MEFLEQKHLALLEGAQRAGRTETENMRLCFAVLALASGIDGACAARLAPYDLSEGKFVLLLLLRDVPEGLAPHDLAERSGVTRATITGLLDGLERDGILARHRDNNDRRKLAVRLTEKGQALARDLVDEHAGWISSLFAGFERHERDTLAALLQRAWHNVGTSRQDSTTIAAGNSR